MAKFIGNVVHPKLGEIEVFETSNKARVYAVSESIGQVPFQQKKAQAELRGLVISAGHGDKLSRKPTALEMANHAPETPEASPEKTPETQETAPESFTVSVSEDAGNVLESVSEPVPEVKRGFFGIRSLFNGGR